MKSTKDKCEGAARPPKGSGKRARPAGTRAGNADASVSKSVLAELQQVQGEKDNLKAKILEMNSVQGALDRRIAELKSKRDELEAEELLRQAEAKKIGPTGFLDSRSSPTIPLNRPGLKFQSLSKPVSPYLTEQCQPGDIFVKGYKKDCVPDAALYESIWMRNFILFASMQLLICVSVLFAKHQFYIPIIHQTVDLVNLYLSSSGLFDFVINWGFLSVAGLVNVYPAVLFFMYTNLIPYLLGSFIVKTIVVQLHYFRFNVPDWILRWCKKDFCAFLKDPIDDFVSCRYMYLYLGKYEYDGSVGPDFSEQEKKSSTLTGLYKPVIVVQTLYGFRYFDKLTKFGFDDSIHDESGRTRVQAIMSTMLPSLLNNKTLSRGKNDAALMAERAIRLSESSLRYVEDYSNFLSSGRSVLQGTVRLAVGLSTGQPEKDPGSF